MCGQRTTDAIPDDPGRGPYQRLDVIQGTTPEEPSRSDETGRELEARDEALPKPLPPQEVEALSTRAAGELATTEPLGLIDKYKLATLRSKKELEAVRVVLDTHLDMLRHQADAAARESKTRWDSKSAEVVSAMKSFVQARLRSIENERMASRLDALQAAYELFAEKVREVERGSLPEDLRQDLIRKMHENLNGTIERLENDSIARKYDLSD